jgi:hypothetical protein
MLLYAQPTSRLTRRITGDITRNGHQIFLRLGDPPVPVPEPFTTHQAAAR